MTGVLLPPPTAETVLPHVPAEWTSTHAIFTAWLGKDRDAVLSTQQRQALRAEVFCVLGRAFLQGRVEKRRLGERSMQWRRA